MADVAVGDEVGVFVLVAATSNVGMPRLKNIFPPLAAVNDCVGIGGSANFRAASIWMRPYP